MVKRRRSRLGNIKDKLMAPEFKTLARELTAPGEAGRAVPGVVQTQRAAQAQSTRPVEIPDTPASTGRTEISTYFTKVGGNQLLYQAEGWVKIRLMLETAGPVAVGSRDDVSPVLSGKGILLPTNVEIAFPLQKGNRIFITAGAVNRVRLIIEPVPWAEQVTTMIGSIVSILRSR